MPEKMVPLNTASGSFVHLGMLPGDRGLWSLSKPVSLLPKITSP